MTRNVHSWQSASLFFLVVCDLSGEGSPNSHAASKSVGVPRSTAGDCSLSTNIPHALCFGNRSRSQLNQTLESTCLSPVVRGLEGRFKKTYRNSSRGLGVVHVCGTRQCSMQINISFIPERAWWALGERRHLRGLSGRRFTRRPFSTADSSTRCAWLGAAWRRTAPSRGSRSATGRSLCRRSAALLEVPEPEPSSAVGRQKSPVKRWFSGEKWCLDAVLSGEVLQVLTCLASRLLYCVILNLQWELLLSLISVLRHITVYEACLSQKSLLTLLFPEKSIEITSNIPSRKEFCFLHPPFENKKNQNNWKLKAKCKWTTVTRVALSIGTTSSWFILLLAHWCHVCNITTLIWETTEIYNSPSKFLWLIKFFRASVLCLEDFFHQIHRYHSLKWVFLLLLLQLRVWRCGWGKSEESSVIQLS